jgi:hypothetical protein
MTNFSGVQEYTGIMNPGGNNSKSMIVHDGLTTLNFYIYPVFAGYIEKKYCSWVLY